ncbi:MAG: sugar ABC transporter ATP-binding protein [Sphaerochaetaceae bacterium]|jgi:ribose transport system ATP-binding protein|nr:sugar ABC transporter ATP-binding protein [Sphaerochaetaceae bacterium]HHU88060.1 sugar ABC transporter ATP-binding protein [Spirochaetales bacterium]
MASDLLVMSNIHKSFPGVKALDEVNFSLKAGEVHALIGENGAGKSTLMKILTGVYKMDEGEILLEGEAVHINKTIDAQNLGISIIYQEFNLFPHLTVAENLYIRREPRKLAKWIIDDKAQRQKTREMLAEIHLDLDPNRKVNTLSVAQQQMLEIAKALALNAKIVIMDEPTSALTDAEIENLFRIIHELKRRKVGIVYISHRLEELQHIADRVTVLRDGKFVGTVDYKDTSVRELVRMMVGRELGDYFPERTTKPEEPLLEVRGLSRKKVIDDISFTLHRGEILGVAGLMGAGRTEMARALFGADHVDSGEILLEGELIQIKSPFDAIRHGIGYLTEDRKRDGLTMGLNVKENIALASIKDFTKWGGRMDDGRIGEVSKEYVDQLQIKTPSLNQLVKFLSGGNQQKVILARWLCKGTKILIFDEPTRGIDVGAKREIYNLMNQLTADGHAIIMISSELPEILGMSDRILTMHEGKVAGITDRASATEESIMYLATGGR